MKRAGPEASRLRQIPLQLLGAGGSVGKFRVRILTGDGPMVMVAQHEKGDWEVRVLTMSCRERD
ncbi:hypothetical protein [Synechococcus sp. BO 8801]|uniref:hypothetical protein n=1 Tax=Synechococcus sp. BO 8801 TaxID=169670 RepID=UPI000B985248|nr:hypothetical protein [Synechococcus sp. BO 8801]